MDAPPDRPGAPAEPLSSTEFARSLRECEVLLTTLAVAILGDRDEAQDAVQEAGLIALGKLEQFEPGTSFPAWMGRIVRFVALNHQRRRANSDSIDPDDIDLRWSAEPTLSSEPERAALVALEGDVGHFDDEVQAALLVLSPVARACLLLRTVHELDYRELSALLGLPEGTAMSHVHRARRAMRERLEERSPRERAPGRAGEAP
jgi:RNA polymerase sigma-70 factor (ECF subfamily)